MNKYLRNAVYGFAVGDALGVPYEFRQRGTFNCTGMTGFGTYNQPAGTWSDDTSLVLATCDSIREKDRIDIPDMIHKFAQFLYECKYTPFGKVFDVGNQTQKAIRYCDRFGVKAAPGENDSSTNGNGGLMRILPLAFFDDTKVSDVGNVCAITHPHNISKQAALIYLDVMCCLIDGDGEEPSLEYYSSMPEFKRLKNLKGLEIKSTGYVVDTLEAALWAFLTTDNYRDCVLNAVNLGGDTDTIAAIAGGLAGVKYGFDAIPADWVSKLANKELIERCLF